MHKDSEESHLIPYSYKAKQLAITIAGVCNCTLVFKSSIKAMSPPSPK